MSTGLVGKVALVTGGSRGIGRAICVALASEGASVFVNYGANSSAAEETTRLCTTAWESSREHVGGATAEASPFFRSLGFDVADSAAVDAAVDSIKSQCGRLDILVNNAGISHDGLLMRFKDEDWRRTIAVNLDGAFFCARAASKIMMKARWGRIVNISSVVGEMGNAGQVAYVSAKAGLIGMTKSMARELASRGITVNAVTPGYIETDMTKDLDPKVMETMRASIPLGRTGSAEEVASAVAYLCGDTAAYITGQTLAVNGGLYM